MPWPRGPLHPNECLVPTSAPAAALLCSLLAIAACSSPLPWPESPLLPLPSAEVDASYPTTEEEAVRAIVGHYAHFDVVAYEDATTRTPMRTFIVSYGFTDFVEEDGRLLQSDRFLFAEYALNQRGVQTSFDEDAVQAIEPRVQQVELSREDDLWRIYRPESPVLLGIEGDPTKPLSRDPDDPNLVDADGDGKPGVTVDLRIGGLIHGEIYITRREVYRDHLALYPDGRIIGHVEDLSEQFVIDANMKILRQQSNNEQVPDPGLNPVLLVPVDASVDTIEALRAMRSTLFPPAPEFR